ncbi:MAG: amylo-alpha-1,6-glucosidase, partial [Bdellovibrionota bacterium]
MNEPPILTLAGASLREKDGGEWLDVNGLGGYASAAITGENTRRYHGLFVISERSSLARNVLLSRLDETLELEGEDRIELGVRTYRDVSVPDGRQYLNMFSQGLYPTIEWSVRVPSTGDTYRIEKSLMMVGAENTLLIRYFFRDVGKPGKLLLDPFIASRFFHDLQCAADAMPPKYRWEEESLLLSHPGGEALFAISVPAATFRSDPDWYYRLYYREEEERGHAAEEDLFRPGVFSLPMRDGEAVFLAISAEPSRYRMGRDEIMQLWADEEGIRKERASSLAKQSSSPLEFFLSRATESFLIRRRESHEHPENQPSLIAGYHWFGDWGRDALISLLGVLHATGSLEVVKEILQTFSVYVKDGLVPNRFSDSDGEAEYNSVDASLWFIVNGFQVLEAHIQEERAFMNEVYLPTARAILTAFRTGTHFHIHECCDGLIAAGAGEEQVTWMDARVDGRAITPRHGKPVEINALWINAHWCLAEILERTGESQEAGVLRERALHLATVYESLFWNEEVQGLFDVVSEEGVGDPAIRPNQIFALSLPFPLLSEDRAAKVVDLVARELLTPYGLRTLSPGDPQYRGRCEGSVVRRDEAYHQGTVWPWLFGAYARAVLRSGSVEMVLRAQEVISGFQKVLLRSGIGTVSEIFDGDAPHHPRGCISQLWSVA